MHKRIDWAAAIDRAEGMSMSALLYAIGDCQKTLPSADAMDRALGSCDGGYYRDEISVYRAEIKRRA